ncbi:hypothetical protein SESBI_13631 [Sesbania bispinosa]|nr:hypothetical protein SESBI_13631 [Sesbania bispinosa]
MIWLWLAVMVSFGVHHGCGLRLLPPCHGSTARPPEKRKEQQGSLRDSAKKKQEGGQRFARAWRCSRLVELLEVADGLCERMRGCVVQERGGRCTV